MTTRARHEVRIGRVYDGRHSDDGKRFLVDGLWPRGVSKSALSSVEWLKDVAPSAALRKWFHHDPDKWKEFQKRYREELRKNADALAPLVEALHESDVTLLTSTRDAEHSHAEVLKEFLEKKKTLG